MRRTDKGICGTDVVVQHSANRISRHLHKEVVGYEVTKNELITKQILIRKMKTTVTFYPVDNGDCNLIEVENGPKILWDCKFRKTAESEENEDGEEE